MPGQVPASMSGRLAGAGRESNTCSNGRPGGTGAASDTPAPPARYCGFTPTTGFLGWRMQADARDTAFGPWPGGLPVKALLAGAGEISATVGAQLSSGYSVRRAGDGVAALAALDAEPFDLVIAEWELPGGGAERLCQGIRAAPRHAELYILVLMPDEGLEPVRALQAGADDYLIHPFRRAELLARARAGSRSAMLHANEVRLRALIANVPGAIYRCANDRVWTMKLISGEIERISGYPASDFVDSSVRTFASIIHPDDRADVENAIARATREGRVYSLQYRVLRADGAQAWVLERGQQVYDGSGRTWLDGAIFDITDRKRSEDALRVSKERLAVAGDRQRIARDLHDGVIQCLFGVGTALQALEAAADDPDQVRATLASSVGHINAVIDDVRTYIHGLRPGLLADRGLRGALQALAGECSDSSGLVVALDVDPAVAAALDEHAADVVQMVREALSNVRRHAGAATCRVSLGHAGGGAILEVDDDGQGFDPGAVSGQGHGLRNLAQRAESLGGRLDIRADAGGTVVRVRLPLGIALPGGPPATGAGRSPRSADLELGEDV